MSIDHGEAPLDAGIRSGAILESGTPGETIYVKAGNEEFYPLTVSGIGETIRWSAIARDVGPIVYAPAELARSLTAMEGFNSLIVRLEDNTPEVARATLADLRSYLDEVAPRNDIPRGSPGPLSPVRGRARIRCFDCCRCST